MSSRHKAKLAFVWKLCFWPLNKYKLITDSSFILVLLSYNSFGKHLASRLLRVHQLDANFGCHLVLGRQFFLLFIIKNSCSLRLEMRLEWSESKTLEDCESATAELGTLTIPSDHFKSTQSFETLLMKKCLIFYAWF